MSKRERSIEFLEAVAYVVDCAILLVFLALSTGVLVKSILWETQNSTRVHFHDSLVIGFVVFFLLLVLPRMRHNIRWLMTFTHEFTHMAFAVLFFRKLNRFNVDDRDSHVSFSSGPFGYIPISLSPYCIPLFTLAMLPWRLTTDQHSAIFLMVIDFLIGLTYAFHVCCWIRQTRFSQTDISGPGKLRSLLVILIFWMMGLSLVLLTPGSGVVKAITRTFWDFPYALVSQFLSCF